MSPPAQDARSESFADFMARALHDPSAGYYARRIHTVGPRGDFSTAATLSPAMGEAVASWLSKERAGMPDVRHVIEVGAGDGSLMAAVRRSLGWWRRRCLRWHVVESSPVLAEAQRARLGGTVEWHSRLEDALRAADGRAFIYHNELLDAFPVHLVEWHGGAWHEIFLTDGVESRRPLDWPDDERARHSALQEWGAPPPGQRCELHRSVRGWLHGWAPAWLQGAMLTVDYGDVFPALYHRRPRGTLRAYLLHQRLEGADVYANPGRQDITADINFTDFRAWTAALGWQETGFGALGDFFRARLKRATLAALPSSFLHPDGAGGAFKWQVVRRQCHPSLPPRLDPPPTQRNFPP